MSNTKRIGWIAAALLLSPALWAETTAIKAGHIVDVEKGVVLEGKVLLIEDGKITDIVDRMPASAPGKVIDLSSSWLVPGLMDMHTHVTYDYQRQLCDIYASDSN